MLNLANTENAIIGLTLSASEIINIYLPLLG